MDAQLFEKIAEAVPGVMYLMAADFSRYIYINPPIERLLGYPAEKFLREGPAFMMSLCHPEDLKAITARHEQRVRELNAAGKSAQDAYTHIEEYRLRHRDGSWKWVRSSAIVFDRTPAGEILTVLGVAQDITEQKNSEQRARLSERLASVGRLAAGMAHEINNPLTHLIGGLELLAEIREPLAPELLRLRMSELHASATRISQIVRDLKLFARPEDDETLEAFAVERAFESSVRLAMAEIRPRARLVRDYAQTTPLVLANEARLGQVLLNLLVNAAQAIPEGDSEHNEIRIITREGPNATVIAEVQDTGCGMEPAVLKQVFDPFFTTKSASKGMGLGLAIAYQIVQSFGGQLEAESTLGRGSLFRVILQAAEGPGPESANARGAERVAAATPTLHGRVLVVDDDPTVAEIVEAALSADHAVEVCTRVEDALERLKRQGNRYDLILCDMIMPQMSGADFYEAVRRLGTGLEDRFVFMTGGAFTEQTQNFLARARNPILHKPFRVKAVRELAQQFLQGRRLTP